MPNSNQARTYWRCSTACVKRVASYFTLAALIIGVVVGPVPSLKSAQAADTGWKSPTANASNDAGSGDDWSNPENAYSNGGGVATEQAGERHRFYNFSFNISSGATINGIEVEAEAWSSDNSGCQIGVDLSWNGGSTWTSEKTASLSGSGGNNDIKTFGGSSDTWLRSWNDTEFSNANFRLRIHDIDPGNSCNNSHTTSLDYIKAKVYYTKTGSISGYKWNDKNGNGVRNFLTEPKLSNWTIKLYQNEQEIDSVVTDNDGEYSFSGLVAGAYKVCEVAQAGWQQTSPVGNGGCYNVNLSEGEKETGKNFGNKQNQEITVYAHKIVCNDESYLPNWHNGADITSATAQDFVNNSNGVCNFVEGWQFQWGDHEIEPKLPGDYVGPTTESGWQGFASATGAAGVPAQVNINVAGDLPDKLWFREVLPIGYLPFSYPSVEYPNTPGSDVSAEFWCNKDVKNYDNSEYIEYESGDSYYCLAFNVLKEQVPLCEPGPVEITNGSFEEPVVGTPELWDIFSSVSGWGITWESTQTSYNEVTRPENALLELHRGVNAWTPSDGNQYAELDTDWFGPSDSTSEEPASVYIHQYVTTIPGADYELKFDFSPRPGEPEADNHVSVRVDDVQLVDYSTSGGAVDWQTKTVSFTASGASTKIGLADIGTPNSLGTFIDNVRLERICNNEPPSPICGNNIKEEGEQCDGTDGVGSNQSCSLQCTIIEIPSGPVCGNEQIEEGETCDDGNTADGDGCSASCQTEIPQCVPEAGWADMVEVSVQGTLKNGNAITDSARIDPEKTLGAADGQFFSLGKNGTITLFFSKAVSNEDGNDLSFHEVTNGRDTYPEERAKVEVSQDGSVWQEIGEASSQAAAGVTYLDFAATGWSWIQYVRLSDTTNYNPHQDNADGYDLDAVDATLLLCEVPDQEPIAGSIHGYKWNDEDGDGQRGEESLMSGWRIFIDEDEDGVWDEDETYMDTDDGEVHYGWYWFENLPYGTYKICEVHQSGWTQTYPASCHVVTLPDGNPQEFVQLDNAVAGPAYNFGNHYTGESGGGGENPIDLCLNLEGIQTEMPDGYEQSEEGQCTEVGGGSPQVQSFSSGGGGGGSSWQLIITNEQILPEVTGDSLTATITWTTNHPATSRLVWDTVSHPFVGSSPMYGYAFTNTEDPTLVVFHTMTVTGLTPGQTYYFRPISHGSPEVNGIELAYTPPGGGGGAVAGTSTSAPAPQVLGATDTSLPRTGGMPLEGVLYLSWIAPLLERFRNRKLKK